MYLFIYIKKKNPQLPLQETVTSLKKGFRGKKKEVKHAKGATEIRKINSKITTLHSVYLKLCYFFGQIKIKIRL